MKVRLSRPAELELVAALLYLERHSPAGARKVRSAIWRTIRNLGQTPNRGRPSALAGLREVPVRDTPYVVVYSVQPDAVIIYRIRHISQDPSPG